MFFSFFENLTFICNIDCTMYYVYHITHDITYYKNGSVTMVDIKVSTLHGTLFENTSLLNCKLW